MATAGKAACIAHYRVMLRLGFALLLALLPRTLGHGLLVQPQPRVPNPVNPLAPGAVPKVRRRPKAHTAGPCEGNFLPLC